MWMVSDIPFWVNNFALCRDYIIRLVVVKLLIQMIQYYANVFLVISGDGCYEFLTLKMIPPFEKGGPGGISDGYPVENPVF